MTVIGPVIDTFAPTHAIFSYTDHSGVTVDSTSARFTRPLVDNTREYVAPGSRVRFRSDAKDLRLLLEFSSRYTFRNTDVPVGSAHWFDVISIFVNGVFYANYNPADNRSTFTYNIDLAFPKSDMRTIEVILPFCASLDFKGIVQHPRYRFYPSLARPTDRIVFIGDSITQGFTGTASRNIWPYLAAELMKMQCVNMGYANAEILTHGTASYLAGMQDVAKVLVMIGINDIANSPQLAVATFKTRYTALLNGILANTAAPKIYAVSPIWTNLSLAIPVSSYHTAISEAVTDIADSRLSLINGWPLQPNSMTYSADGVHPNDLGHAAIAANLAVLI